MIATITKEHELLPDPIDAKTTVGKVTLGVADLAMMTDFYTRLIGLSLIDNTASAVELGVEGKPLLRLEKQENGRQYPNAVGLYHFAILVPSRAALGQWLGHLSASHYKLTGASDHLASEALYLDDPEGNGIEVYRDRPRDKWVYENGELKLATLRLDLQSLLADANPVPFEQLPSGTTMGHVHLQVDHVERTAEFYQRVLGFDIIAIWPEAGFLSAGGYHHHLGMNIWHSKGQSRPPAGSLGLLHYEIKLPTNDTRNKLLDKLDSSGIAIEEVTEYPSVVDPSGNRAVLVV